MSQMSQDLQANFQSMISEGKFSLGLKELQKTISLCKNPVISYSIYEVIAKRCENILHKIIQSIPEINKITRSDLEDFNEKTERFYNIIQEIRDREKISKILEARNDYDLVKQIQWNLDVLDRRFKISSKEQIYRQSQELLEQQCQKTKHLDEYQSKLLQFLAFFNKDQNKITQNMEVTEDEKMVLRKLGEIYKHSGEKVIEFYQQKKAGILCCLKKKYIEEIQNDEEQRNNFQHIFTQKPQIDPNTTYSMLPKSKIKEKDNSYQEQSKEKSEQQGDVSLIKNDKNILQQNVQNQPQESLNINESSIKNKIIDQYQANIIVEYDQVSEQLCFPIEKQQQIIQDNQLQNKIKELEKQNNALTKQNHDLQLLLAKYQKSFSQLHQNIQT